MTGSMAISGYGMTNGYNNYNDYSAYGNKKTADSATADSAQPGRATQKHSANPDDQVKSGRKSSPSECKTCKSRKYQDGSNESDVSFKAPGHISPQASAGTVRAHEQQHVNNAYEKAAKNNGKVLSATVSLQTEICPECGTAYVAGGVTRTRIAYSAEENPYQKNQKALDAVKQIGANIDYVA